MIEKLKDLKFQADLKLLKMTYGDKLFKGFLKNTGLTFKDVNLFLKENTLSEISEYLIYGSSCWQMNRLLWDSILILHISINYPEIYVYLDEGVFKVLINGKYDKDESAQFIADLRIETLCTFIFDTCLMETSDLVSTNRDGINIIQNTKELTKRRILECGGQP